MKLKDSEKIAWHGLSEIYKFLGNKQANKIVQLLLERGKLQPKIIKKYVPMHDAQLFPMLKGLVLCQILEKIVYEDRTTTYQISNFGKEILELTIPMLNEIEKKFTGKKSILENIE